VFSNLLNRIQDKVRQMAAMQERVGVDPADAARIRGGAALAAAWRRCLACRNGKDCATWLKAPASANQQPPPFCPNAAFLAEASARPASWPAPTLLAGIGDDTQSRK
jgi:Family of unknown function (DUF6455)